MSPVKLRANGGGGLVPAPPKCERSELNERLTSRSEVMQSGCSA